MTAGKEYLINVQRMRKLRADKAASFRDGAAPPDDVDEMPPTRQRTVSAIQADYFESATGREHRKRLDDLILKRTTEPPSPTLTGGDLHRASLPVGMRLTGAKFPATTILYEKTRPQRDAEYKELAAIIVKMVPTLPDVVILADIVERLDPALVETMDKRLPICLSRALRAGGAVKRYTSTNGASKNTYLIRCVEAYQGMSVKALMAHRDARTRTRPGDPRPAGERRGQGRRKAGLQWLTAAQRRQRRRDLYHARKAGNDSLTMSRPRAVGGRSSKSQNRPDTAAAAPTRQRALERLSGADPKRVGLKTYVSMTLGGIS